MKSYLASYQGKGETVTPSALNLSRITDVIAKIDALSGTVRSAPPAFFRPLPAPGVSSLARKRLEAGPDY